METCLDLALGRVLGILRPEQETVLQEHLRSDCPQCKVEFEQFDQLVGKLCLSATAAQPSLAVRERLMQTVARLQGARQPHSRAHRANSCFGLEIDKADWYLGKVSVLGSHQGPVFPLDSPGGRRKDSLPSPQGERRIVCPGGHGRAQRQSFGTRRLSSSSLRKCSSELFVAKRMRLSPLFRDRAGVPEGGTP